MTEPLARLAGELAELVVGERLERGADDLEVTQQLDGRQVQEARQQLASRQIAGGAEEDDHMWTRCVHSAIGATDNPGPGSTSTSVE